MIHTHKRKIPRMSFAQPSIADAFEQSVRTLCRTITGGTWASGGGISHMHVASKTPIRIYWKEGHKLVSSPEWNATKKGPKGNTTGAEWKALVSALGGLRNMPSKGSRAAASVAATVRCNPMARPCIPIRESRLMINHAFSSIWVHTRPDK